MFVFYIFVGHVVVSCFFILWNNVEKYYNLIKIEKLYHTKTKYCSVNKNTNLYLLVKRIINLFIHKYKV